MAKLFAYFIFFILSSLILRPKIHAVEARLLSKGSGRQRNELRRSSEEVEPAKSGPSPGAGHELGGKRTVVVNANSGPSPGVGHGFDRKDYGKRNIITGMRSGPSPGDGNGIQNSKKNLVAVNNEGPSPGEGHKHVPAAKFTEETRKKISREKGI